MRLPRLRSWSLSRAAALRLLLLLALAAALGAQYAAQSDPPRATPPQAAPSESGAQEETLPEFEPTETVSADDAVPFPVDI